MRTIAFFVACLLFSVTTTAQTRVVKGQLTIFNKYPVQNVEVAAKKAKSSVMTDSLGQFEIVCNEKDVILIKAKVFQALSKKVDSDEDFISANLIFRDSPKNREIATGMGYISPEQLTFALAHLADENNDFCSYPDVFSLIRGKFPGVQIISGGVHVRGQRSLTGDTEAIYVVDGMIVADISFVVPCDLATIDILKDGGAALYGSRAANGVVVMETKGHRAE